MGSVVKKVKKAVKKHVKSVRKAVIPKEVDPIKQAISARDSIQGMTEVPDAPDVNIENGAQDAPMVEEEAPAPEFGGRDSEGNRARRKGRKSLRINLRTGNAGSGGTGLNIPRS